MNYLSYTYNAFINLFFPNFCTVCKKELIQEGSFLCLHCLYELPYINRYIDFELQIQKIMWGRVNIVCVYSLLNYQKGNSSQEIIHLIKYKNKIKLAHFMGELLGTIIPLDHNIDYIIPIPLHPKKEKVRGYNQSYVLSEGLNNITKIPILNTVVIRNTINKSQTQFTKYDRWQNVENIFELTQPSLLENKHLLILDDVLTTGATLESCIKTIQNSINCKISIATLAVRL